MLGNTNGASPAAAAGAGAIDCDGRTGAIPRNDADPQAKCGTTLQRRVGEGNLYGSLEPARWRGRMRQAFDHQRAAENRMILERRPATPKL
jgi:hypothetical protein